MGKVKLSPVCVLCKKDVNDELRFGPLRKTKVMRVHYYCLLLSETILQSGQDDEGILGFMASDIIKELNRTKNQQCCYCRESPATIGCSNSTCNRKFHLLCGYQNSAVFNFDKFDARCNFHTKPSNVPAHIRRSLTDYHCLICLEVFDAETHISDVIWANCCKSNVILHCDCVRKMALNAGYFTKCPGCNDKSKFISTIKSWGIFVPERDASWELDRNAFSELLYVHSQCDQKICTCPNGREHVEENGKWKIMLCKMCGSVGAHVTCSELKRRFICDVCSLDASTAPSTSDRVSSTPEVEDLTTADDEYDDDIIEVEIIEVPEEEEGGVEIVDLVEEDIESSDCDRSALQKGDNEEINHTKHDNLIKKRPLEVINNFDRNEENSMACKKFRSNVESSETNHNFTNYKRICETIDVESLPSYTITLDDNNEVEFVSCSVGNSMPPDANDVDLFLNTVLSTPEEKKDMFNKENQVNCNLVQTCDVQQDYLSQSEHGSKPGKKVVELNFRNYTQHCAKVSF